MIRYTYEFEDPTGRAARVRRPRRRHEFTIARDHTVRAGGSKGQSIGRVELRDKRWFPFGRDDVQLSGDRGYRRAGDAGSVLYLKYLKDGGMSQQQLSLFAQYERTATVEDAKPPKKRSKPMVLDERSPEFQARKRIRLCAEWYHFEEGDAWKAAYGKCRKMEAEGRLRDDGSYIPVGGRKNQARIEASGGVFIDVSAEPTPEAKAAALRAAASGSGRRADARGHGAVPSGLLNKVVRAMSLIYREAPAGQRAVPPRVPRRLWVDAVSKMRAWKEAGEPEGGRSEVEVAVERCAVKMDLRGFDEVWARVESDARYGRFNRGQRASVSLEDLPALKRAYAKAKKAGDETFMFKGAEILVAYAKYLIEHMENLSKGGRRAPGDKVTTGAEFAPVSAAAHRPRRGASTARTSPRQTNVEPSRMEATAMRREIVSRFNRGELSEDQANAALARLGKRWAVLGTPVRRGPPPGRGGRRVHGVPMFKPDGGERPVWFSFVPGIGLDEECGEIMAIDDKDAISQLNTRFRDHKLRQITAKNVVLDWTV